MKMQMAVLGLLGCCLVHFGCSTGPRSAPLAGPTAGRQVDVRDLPMFEGYGGAIVDWEGLIVRAASADVVLIGERHGHDVGLATAGAIFQDILARRPESAALSLEFFERDQQAALDDYLLGITDESEFRQATGRNRSNYPEGHREMLEAARAADRPVYAANAPRRYVRLARIDGFDRLGELTGEQRRLYTVPAALTEGRYRESFFEVMSGPHGESPADDAEQLSEQERAEKQREADEMVLSFYRSQNVWDATMARTIADALDAGAQPVVHVVGSFHVDFEGGLVERLRAMSPGVRVLVVCVAPVWADELLEEDHERADVIIYVGED